MKRTGTGLAWTSSALVSALTALNWPAMTAMSAIDRVVTEVRLPLGLLMLALAAVPTALFFVAHLHQQIGTLMETRRLLREVQRAHDPADKAEGSRIDGLRQLMSERFRSVNERLDSLHATLPAKPTGFPGTAGLRRMRPGAWKDGAHQPVPLNWAPTLPSSR